VSASADTEREFQEEALPHMDAVYRYARRLAGNEKDAEDLLQETYLRAFRFWHNYQKGTNCKAWLFRILRNLSINRAQSQARQPISASLEDTEDYFLYGRLQDPDQSLIENPERTFFTHNWSPEILAALDKLPEEYRSSVILCDVEGMSYQEIAEILDVPIGTVRSRLNRARGKLQQLLLEYVKENQPDLLKHREEK
jgi:RNA polymerase sigma-70 factor (ECF subfamily)